MLVMRLVATAVALVALSSCSSGSKAPAAPDPSVPVLANEQSNGKTVDVGFGGRVIVTMHSTEWKFDPSLQVLQQFGPPSVAASPCSGGGSGCGTIEVTYNAHKVGTTTIHAHRARCGNGAACTGKNADWALTVRVS